MIKSVYSEKIEIRKEGRNVIGLFAKEDIESGEIVFVKGGYILRKNELYSSGKANSYIPINKEYYIGASNELNEKKIKRYINHSCDPNCGIRGEITFVAMRDIKKGEQVTVDYAFIDDDNYSFECACGCNNCRKVITGKDWKIKSLQEKYYPYFSTYIKQRIDSLKKSKKPNA